MPYVAQMASMLTDRFLHKLNSNSESCFSWGTYKPASLSALQSMSPTLSQEINDREISKCLAVGKNFNELSSHVWNTKNRTLRLWLNVMCKKLPNIKVVIHNDHINIRKIKTANDNHWLSSSDWFKFVDANLAIDYSTQL